MSLGLGSHTGSTRFAVLLDKFTKSRPGVVAKDKTSGFVLTRVSREDMIVFVSEYAKSEVGVVRNVDA